MASKKNPNQSSPVIQLKEGRNGKISYEMQNPCFVMKQLDLSADVVEHGIQSDC